MKRPMHDRTVRERTVQAIAEAELDAVVVTSRQNLRHLANLYLPHLSVVPEEHVFLICRRDGERQLLIPEWMPTYAKERTDIPVTVWSYGTGAWNSLADALRQQGLDEARIGIEAEYMAAADRDRLARVLPKATLVSADRALLANRLLKTPDEIAVIAEVAAAGERAMVEAIAEGREGMTDREFAKELRLASIRQGVDEVSWLALNWASPEQRTQPTDRPIRPGQVFSIEFGLCIDGYYSDLQRTVAVAPVPGDVQEAYEKLAGVHERTIARMTPGRSVASMHDEFLADMRDNGLQMWDWWLGHSIGLDVHEGLSLWLREGEKTIFEPGMVFAVEPVITEPAVLAFEDLVVIETTGPRVLSSQHNWDTLAILGERVE
ncbi:M24 family metallopeptidase [Streptomyces sp. NPDC001027]|uniref:M24 family metallopeptidase n=1 Tax=Streptomyces sp. NPDC001027 TaxID=3154771 RepID=UPI0033257107